MIRLGRDIFFDTIPDPHPGPIQPVLDRLDPLLATPASLIEAEIEDLITFVRDGLLDDRARPENLCKLVPASVPSGKPVLDFQAPVIPNTSRITINVLEPLDHNGHSYANTFGYSTLVEPYLTIDNELTNFITANFADCE